MGDWEARGARQIEKNEVRVGAVGRLDFWRSTAQ
jgi:hypothetical protein